MYHSKLNIRDTEIAIKIIKTVFEEELSCSLKLLRVSAPLFLESNTGLNDNLTGTEIPITFTVNNQQLEIVQSLAKWKRMALYRYEIPVGSGIYADMNAIRPTESLDCLHSLYVDQWDWEKTISKEERNLETLKNIVQSIYKAILITEQKIFQYYPMLKPKLPEQIIFISSQELENLFPTLTPKEREYEITKIHKAVFIIGIGHKLNSGIPHDKRAPDYDDWVLNGDILFYHESIDMVLEISSMGIRVDSETMSLQLLLANAKERKNLDFHKMIFNEVLPLSVGGGIGQSRLSMFLLEKVHIGEVQVSIWPDEIRKECSYNRIFLL